MRSLEFTQIIRTSRLLRGTEARFFVDLGPVGDEAAGLALRGVEHLVARVDQSSAKRRFLAGRSCDLCFLEDKEPD